MQLNEPKEFIKIKDRYANLLILTITTFGFIALIVSLWDTPKFGFKVDNIIDILGYLTILSIFIFRKELSISFKIGTIILFAYIIGTAGLMVGSVISMFMPYYIIGALFSMLFLDTKKTIWLVSIQVITVLTAFVLKVAGILTFSELDASYRIFSNANWFNYIFTFILFVIVIIIMAKRFYGILYHTITDLNSLNAKLSEEIKSKENAYEEIAATEEELKTTNDELVNVNRELSIRNKELISTLWKLQESETRFKTLFESASDTFLILKGDTIVDCNHAAEAIFKLPMEKIIGKKPFELSPEYQKDGTLSKTKTREIFDKVLATRKPVWYEWEHTNANGESFTTHVSLNHFSFNKEAHYHAIIRDISDQKKFEQNLLESEDKFKKIFDFNPAAIALSTFNEHFRCLDINKSFEKLVKAPKNEIIGKKITELGYSIPNDIYIKFREELRMAGFFSNAEISIHLPDHSIIECIVSGILISFFQEPMVMTITVDITEQKRTQQKLQQYQNYLEDLVNERTDEIQQLNEELTKINENLIESNEELLHQKEELASTIEELRNTQSQLVQSEKMASLGVLTAGIAHEINNPINFISSGVYGLQSVLHSLTDYIASCEQIKKMQFEKNDNGSSLKDMIDGAERLIENIQLGVDRTTAIVRSLRIFSFPGTGNKELMDIQAGIDATLVMVNHLIKDRIQVERKYEVIPQIYCLSSQINQVFMNIIYNAIDSIKGQGTISIHTTADLAKNNVIISIADNGVGIPENIKKRIFEPFFTTKEVGKGTGLGLSISYNIIREHQGELYFKSNNGKGTIFFIELPIIEAK